MPVNRRFSSPKRLWRHLPSLVALCLGLVTRPAAADFPAAAQRMGALNPVHQTATVELTVQLRHGDGTAVVGEPVALERPPEAEPILPDCVTDESGRCRWWVGRGVYQLRFSRPLDEISALALAEGGLNGLGITVGETAVTYHFTFHSDGRVYFDAAPAAAVPQPILPAGELWHGGILPTLTPTVATVSPEGSVWASPEDPAAVVEASLTAGKAGRRLVGYIGGGLLLSITVHLCQQRRRRLATAEANRD